MRWARSSYQSLIVARNSGHMTFLVLLPVSARPAPRPRGYQMIQESLGGPRNTMGPGTRLSRILESSSWKRPADPRPRCLLESSPAPPLSPVVAVRAAYPSGPQAPPSTRTPPMATVPAPLPQIPPKDVRCPGRIEVDSADAQVSAATVKAWVAHLRTHGWTEKDLGLVWLMRARQGVTR